MKKKWGIPLLIILLFFGGTGAYILKQNSFDMIEQAVEISTPQGKLTGVLILPEHYSSKLGLVLFIHGDGAIDATHDDGYKPLWERLASLGYASLSMDKRGISGSEGNWLDQTMEDRVEEAQQVLAWARQQPEIDANRIGVWGASQAGWVIPKLAGKEQLAFSILVSPAINWLTQGEYNTRSQMTKEGRSSLEIEEQVNADNRIKDLLKAGASYAEYVSAAGPDNVMSKDRWNFVSKNYLADATNDIYNFNSPVLLMLGDHDIHVDIKETEEVYKEHISPSDLLHVRMLKATEHSMLSTATADSPTRALLISLFAPRDITVKGYMEEITHFLQSNHLTNALQP
ncbi:alpha/beta hydrolase [Chryseobacterium mucoviscidosis]|uniref:alpha/beta hydrolase family protein n=2 Tax=unclassified Paenibacillus TaxID=185978 RepID=UPI0009A32788|nr:CocE/NonD family hydrolase [Paenibacillus sp. 11B]MDN8587142.1 CocE/NonD family hydrolase [Paenibacillus sp. 11B]OPG99155.1 alpha/beta hydrolase [Chryseobacterium mucoviscidosis]